MTPKGIQMTKDEARAEFVAMGARVPPSGLLNRIDVARYLGVDDSTLRKWREAGVGPPCIKCGGQWKYPIAGLAEWLTHGDSR